MSAAPTTGPGAPPAAPAPAPEPSLREQVARLLVEGQGLDPDERCIPAESNPVRLANGRRILPPAFTTSVPLWVMFVDDAERVVDAFGERTIAAALAMVRA